MMRWALSVALCALSIPAYAQGGSYSQAEPPKLASQLLGGEPSRQMYQSRYGLSRALREAWNHGCWSEVWFGR